MSQRKNALGAPAPCSMEHPAGRPQGSPLHWRIDVTYRAYTDLSHPPWPAAGLPGQRSEAMDSGHGQGTGSVVAGPSPTCYECNHIVTYLLLEALWLTKTRRFFRWQNEFSFCLPKRKRSLKPWRMRTAVNSTSKSGPECLAIARPGLAGLTPIP